MNESSSGAMKDKTVSPLPTDWSRTPLYSDRKREVNGETHHRPALPAEQCLKQHKHGKLPGDAGITRPRPRRKLVLHFDIRNTVLVADSVTNVNVEQAINSFLTGVTWGWTDEKSGEWKWHSDTPSLSPPAPTAITYYKCLEKELVRTPRDRTMLRINTGDFTQRRIGMKFKPYFDRLLHQLEWPFSIHPKSESILTMKGRDGDLYHYILPSFFKLLYQLKKEGRDFAVIFRTYGLDSDNVLQSTNHTVQGNHPQFPETIDLKVNLKPGTIRRHTGGPIVLETKFDKAGPSRLYTDERSIYKKLSETEGVTAYKDDFRFWQTNGYHYKAGKPLWVDLNDVTVHHILFDDNMRAYEDDNIVDLRLLDGHDAKSVDKADLAQYENVFMVQANLMRSIEDENYFIEEVDMCEKKLTELLKKRNSSYC